MMKRIASVLLVLICLLLPLASCANRDGGKPADTPEAARAALKENGYTVTMTTDEALLEHEGLNTTLYAYRDEDVITIHYFDTAADANAAWDSIKKDGYICKKSDCMIWIATSAGVFKDAR